MVAKRKEELAQKKQEAEDLASAVKNLGDIVLLRKVGKGNQIFGSVTNKQVIEEVTKKSGGKGEETSLPGQDSHLFSEAPPCSST